jgi:mono/diheme cytochrome c family protein
MKKVAKRILIGAGILLFIIGCGLLYVQFSGIRTYETQKIDLKVEVTPERVSKGRKIASMVCMQCHVGADGKLTGKFLKDVPAELGRVYSRNITNDPEIGVGKWTDGEIYYLLRTGISKEGKYYVFMPQFPLVSDEDIKSIIAWLRSDDYTVQAASEEPPPSQSTLLTKCLSRLGVFEPFSLPEKSILSPDTANKIQLGKYLSGAVYTCYVCHSAGYMDLNSLEPEKSKGYYGGGFALTGLNGETINASNITLDQTGIADYSLDDFIKAVKYGRKKDGQLVRYPMFPHANLDDYEVEAIYEYLKTVPKINNTVQHYLSKPE